MRLRSGVLICSLTAGGLLAGCVATVRVPGQPPPRPGSPTAKPAGKPKPAAAKPKPKPEHRENER